MTIKTCKTAVRAGAVLAAFALSGGAFATVGITESFEEKTVGNTLEAASIPGLAGNGTIASGGSATEPAMGYPIQGSHQKALEIAGTVTYTEDAIASPTGASQVDFMFKVEPTDELEDPTGDDIRVALAVGTNAVGTTTAPIKLWCKKTASAANPEWVSLGDFETGTWVRATLVLDYGTPKKCSVSLNGDPALNAADSSSKWFYFANNGGSYVASITMVGSTMVDDFVVTHEALTSYTPAGSNIQVPDAPTGMTYDYINTYGITTNQVAEDVVLNTTSGMKISEKFTAGLDPKSNTKFELKTMTPVDANSATVTFPGNKTSGYTVTVYDADKTTPVGTPVTSGFGNAGMTEAGEKLNSATVTLPANKDLLYIKVQAN